MIAENIQQITKELPPSVRLVAVSKFHPAEAIEEAYAAGQRIFGESRMQELVAKYEALPKDIQWHFIGHLQTNKVRHILPCVTLIESIDSPRLLREVNKQAAEIDKTVDVLLQLHIAQEETKFGFDYKECREFLTEGSWQKLNHVRICGVMGMASNTNNLEQVQHEFASLYTFFQEIKTKFFADRKYFKEVSMGMSHDYKLAIAEGSTLVRVGSKIFGERNYH
ncbi:pyridoxal phosphate enzyme, YggS family [gut metagenome]|uniref:Pyridoxal phosphate enzyme, YggS family n=1 Tax=gut metagenome TaxID=749906 RepID=J9F9E2_9ZZZZ